MSPADPAIRPCYHSSSRSATLPSSNTTVSCCAPPLPQWGHDFRPEYCKLGILKRQFAHVPVLAVTATCTDFIRSDVSEESIAKRALESLEDWCDLKRCFPIQ